MPKIPITDLNFACQPGDQWFDETEDKWVDFNEKLLGDYFHEIYSTCCPVEGTKTFNPLPTRGDTYRIHDYRKGHCYDA